MPAVEPIPASPLASQEISRQQLADWHAESYGWALACCGGNSTAAEEALQTAYARILGGQACFNGHSQPRTWWFGVIRNTARELARRERWRHWHISWLGLREESMPDGESHPAERLQTSDRDRLLKQALQRLPARQREVLHLVFYHGLSLSQAAESLSLTVGSASRHYARAKDSLRRHLHHLGYRHEHV